MKKPIEAFEKVEAYFRIYYGKYLKDLVISDVPGYWKDKTEGYYPNHPMAKCLGSSPNFKATYSYLDHFRDEKGRFASTTRTWKLIYDYEKTN